MLSVVGSSPVYSSAPSVNTCAHSGEAEPSNVSGTERILMSGIWRVSAGPDDNLAASTWPRNPVHLSHASMDCRRLHASASQRCVAVQLGHSCPEARIVQLIRLVACHAYFGRGLAVQPRVGLHGMCKLRMSYPPMLWRMSPLRKPRLQGAEWTRMAESRKPALIPSSLGVWSCERSCLVSRHHLI